MPNIKLRDGSGVEQVYEGVDTISVPLATTLSRLLFLNINFLVLYFSYSGFNVTPSSFSVI